MSVPRDPGLRHAALMCLAAGYVDAYGYFELGHVFTANMTGNTVLMAVALAAGDWTRFGLYLATLAAFLAGAFAATVLKRLLGRGFPALLLAAAVLAVLALEPPPATAMLAALAFAMGLQAGSFARFAGIRVQTVVLTSTLVRLAESAAGVGSAESVEPGRHGSAKTHLTVWASYACGAAGAVLIAPRLPWPLAVPALLLLATALDLVLRLLLARRR